MLQQRRKGCILEQEKKKSPHFLRWPWNVVIYILLFVALRLFALPIVLISMVIRMVLLKDIVFHEQESAFRNF